MGYNLLEVCSIWPVIAPMSWVQALQIAVVVLAQHQWQLVAIKIWSEYHLLNGEYLKTVCDSKNVTWFVASNSLGLLGYISHLWLVVRTCNVIQVLSYGKSNWSNNGNLQGANNNHADINPSWQLDYPQDAAGSADCHGEKSVSAWWCPQRWLGRLTTARLARVYDGTTEDIQIVYPMVN